MKHKTLSAGQHSKFACPDVNMTQICTVNFRPHEKPQIYVAKSMELSYFYIVSAGYFFVTGMQFEMLF